MTNQRYQRRAFGACIPSAQSAASFCNHTSTLDRRRSQRRQLRQAMTVNIQAVGENEGWRIKGDLLNLSPDGMACRISADSSTLLQVGATLLLSFRMNDSQPFEILARMNNMIEAGTPGHMVMGLEFAEGDGVNKQKQRLQSILDHADSE